MPSFPIEQIKSELLSALTTHNTIILTAPPGAGKSTVLPLWLLATEFAQNTIYLLQPRRVAAKNIACYLAQQLGENVGETVGYRLRNESKVSKNTKLEVITEGILTQLLQQDPEIAESALILFDEFHERSVQADIAFALARDCQQGLRDDLTLVLMSATLATEQLLSQLPDAISLCSEGKSYPVSQQYLTANKQVFWREHALKVIKQHAYHHQGSSLVFLPGVADIQYLADNLTDQPSDVVIAPLYGELSLNAQQQAIKAVADQRKIVLATNIAETSLTIDGISLVIDAGFEKVAIFDPNTLTNQLVQKPISKASAIQRAGRAGRLSAGHCIRLYGEDDFQRRPEQASYAIFQTDLLPILIEAARWGVNQLTDLPMLDLPSPVLEQQAWQILQQLSIVDKQNKLTKHGQQVAKLACHPRFAHMLIAAMDITNQASDQQIIYTACLLAALLEERDVFTREQTKDNADIGTRLEFIIRGLTQGRAGNKLSAKVVRIEKQARQLAKQLNIKWQPQISRHWCGVLLAFAFPERIAKNRHQQGRFLSSAGTGLALSIDDTLNDEDYIVAASTIKLANEQRISLAAPVSLAELEQWQVVTIKAAETLTYQEQKDAIVASEQVRLGAIVISEKPINSKLTEMLIIDMWHQQLTKKGLAWLSWSENCQALLARINWLAANQTELDLPVLDESWLMANLQTWFDPYVGAIKKKSALLNLDYESMLLAILDYEQQQVVERCAPPFFVGPTGRKCPIRYNGEMPIVSMPMQEVYGLAQSPQVGDISQGKGVNLTLELLSPAGRPLQVTQDLAGFWQGSYQQVQKEMKGRYPKHYWPDDPANAKATNKTKKYM